MNNFLNKLERKFGRYAIRNLSLYLILGYAIGYVLSLMGYFTGVSVITYLTLDPYLILHGQIWRIISWILIPPSGLDIFTIIMLYFYYSIGTTLERTWGAFRYNVYIIGGMIFSVLGAFLLYVLYAVIANINSMFVGSTISMSFTTYYINLSIFLAFAAVYPNMEVLLFFVIPVKMKWMAVIDAIIVGYDLIVAIRGGSLAVVVAIVMSLLNFIVFFFATRDYKRISYKEYKRKSNFRKEINAINTNKGYIHKCAICGRTEKDDETLEFRYCSKCAGNKEYCNEHLFTHEHVK